MCRVLARTCPGIHRAHEREKKKRKTPLCPPRRRIAQPTNVSSRRTSGLESRDGRRSPYAATVDYSIYSAPASAPPSPPREQYRQHHHHHHHHHYHYQCHRRGRSASPEMLRSSSSSAANAEEQQSRDSPGSSPEPDDNSSTSGDEGESPGGKEQRQEELFLLFSREVWWDRCGRFDVASWSGWILMVWELFDRTKDYLKPKNGNGIAEIIIVANLKLNIFQILQNIFRFSWSW